MELGLVDGAAGADQDRDLGDIAVALCVADFDRRVAGLWLRQAGERRLSAAGDEGLGLFREGLPCDGAIGRAEIAVEPGGDFGQGRVGRFVGGLPLWYVGGRALRFDKLAIGVAEFFERHFHLFAVGTMERDHTVLHFDQFGADAEFAGGVGPGALLGCGCEAGDRRAKTKAEKWVRPAGKASTCILIFPRKGAVVAPVTGRTSCDKRA